MAEAPELEALYQEYKDRGYIVITLLGENNSGGAPTTDELQEWAASYGSTHPLVSDAGFGYGWNFMSGALPSQTLMGPGAVLVQIDQYGLGGSDIEEVLPD